MYTESFKNNNISRFTDEESPKPSVKIYVTCLHRALLLLLILSQN